MGKEATLANSNAENKEVTTTVIENHSKQATEEAAAKNNNQGEMDELDKFFEDFGKDKPSEEKTTTEVEDCGCADNENTPVRKTWKAVINGESQDIIIAFTDYNMEIPKKKHELFKLIDKENLLPVKYNLAIPDIFWKESYKLTDCEDNVIEPGTPNVYVLCPEAGTNCRIMFDEVLEDVAIHEFESVKDWAIKVGTTHQLTLAMNKVKEVGIAGLATGEKAAKEVFAFSKENKVNTSISEIFLDTRLKPQAVSKMMLGIKPKMELAIGRTPEEAQMIFDQCRLTFGDGEVKKRYVGRAVNSILKQEKFSLELVMEALRTIPASDVAYAKLMDCGTKEACIAGVLISWMIDMQRKAA